VPEPTDVHRRLVAVFAADVEGYSRLMGADEVGTLKELTDRRAILDKAITDHRGRIVNTAGDSVLAEFGSAVDAVQCAVAAQAALAEANSNLSPDKRVNFRIGIHVGDVMVRAGDLFGDGVNIAARLQTLAQPGGVCVSGATYDQVRKVLPVAFTDLGAQQVKNIDEPVRAFAVASAAAPSSFFVGEGRAGGSTRVGAGSSHLTSTPTPNLSPQGGGELSLPDKPSIAVLPFQNISGDPEQEYFADGTAEDIITALSRFPSLFVIARNSSFTYKGKPVDIKQVGRELGVRYVLEGSVRKGGNRVRITAQLIDASTGNHIWADRYDRELTDIFAVQDEITTTITARLGTSIERAEIDASRRKSASNLGAYDYYLRGRAFRQNHSGSAAGLQSRAFCERAIEIDPEFAPAHAELSYTYHREVAERWDVSRREEAITKGLAAATRAIALDPALSTAHMTMGMLLFRSGDYEGATESGQRAIELNPNDPESYIARGNVLYYTNRSREALALFQKAQLLDPFYPPVYDYFLGRCYLGHGELEHAIAHARACVRRSPNFWAPHAILAAAHAHAGDKRAAEAALAEMLRLYPVGSLARYRQEGDYQPGPETAYLYAGLRLAGLPE